jgi:pilus assembly protein CpaF
VITLASLFYFKYDGENADGTIKGTFEATGTRPRFLPRLEYYGLGSAFLKAISVKNLEI